MGLLVVGAVAGILISLAWFAPSHGYYSSYVSQPYFNSAVSSGPLEPRPTVMVSTPAHAKATPKVTTASEKSPSREKRSPVKLVPKTPPPAKTRVAASDHPTQISDAVMDKAKATIAAKMEDPASAEFSDMKRAMRKNMLGYPIDTICGRVRGKNASGGEIGEKPFLYLVNEDEAYVVDGRENSAAAIAYRNICR